MSNPPGRPRYVDSLVAVRNATTSANMTQAPPHAFPPQQKHSPMMPAVPTYRDGVMGLVTAFRGRTLDVDAPAPCIDGQRHSVAHQNAPTGPTRREIPKRHDQ